MRVSRLVPVVVATVTALSACGSADPARPTTPRATVATTASDPASATPTISPPVATSSTAAVDNPTGPADVPSLMCDVFTGAMAQEFMPQFSSEPESNTNGECLYKWTESSDRYGYLTLTPVINAKLSPAGYLATTDSSVVISSAPVPDLGSDAVSEVYRDEVFPGARSVSTAVVWSRDTDLYILQYSATDETAERIADVVTLAGAINRALV